MDFLENYQNTCFTEHLLRGCFWSTEMAGNLRQSYLLETTSFYNQLF